MALIWDSPAKSWSYPSVARVRDYKKQCARLSGCARKGGAAKGNSLPMELWGGPLRMHLRA